MDRRMARAFRQAVARVRATANLAAAEVAAAAGDAAGLIRALGLDAFAEAMQAQDIRAIGAALVEEAGSQTAAMLASMFAVEYSFDMTNPQVVRFIEQYDLQLIQALDPTQREAIRLVLLRSQREGIEPARLARLIRPHIGLNDRQANSLFTRQIEWMEAGLDDTEVMRRTERLADKMIRYRAVSIARTETMRAVNEGQQLAWRDAVDKGVIVKADMRKVPIVTPDELLCPVCEPMPDMEENADLDYDEPITTGTGEKIMAPPVHTRCRCTVGLEPRE